MRRKNNIKSLLSHAERGLLTPNRINTHPAMERTVGVDEARDMKTKMALEVDMPDMRPVMSMEKNTGGDGNMTKTERLSKKYFRICNWNCASVKRDINC